MANSATERILLIEDDEDIRELLKSALDRAHFEVFESGDGSEALELVTKHRYDMIISDIKLPGANGLDIAAKARAEGLNRDVPLILVSGHYDIAAARRAKKVGINQVFVKPFSPGAIVEQVKLILSRTRNPLGYDPRIIGGFCSSLQGFLSFHFGDAVVMHPPRLRENPFIGEQVTGAISFSGPKVHGVMALICGRQLIGQLADKLGIGELGPLSDSQTSALAAEASNQVCGRVKNALGKLGVHLKIGLPEIVMGKDQRLKYGSDNPIVRIPANIGIANVALEFCMEQSVADLVDLELAVEAHMETGAALWD